MYFPLMMSGCNPIIISRRSICTRTTTSKLLAKRESCICCFGSDSSLASGSIVEANVDNLGKMQLFSLPRLSHLPTTGGGDLCWQNPDHTCGYLPLTKSDLEIRSFVTGRLSITFLRLDSVLAKLNESPTFHLLTMGPGDLIHSKKEAIFAL